MPFSLKILAFLLLSISFSCDKDEVCELINCENGGTCINGSCNCTAGYTGGNCSQQIVPSSIRITKITVLRFPSTNENGETWDLGNGADIYVALGFQDSLLYEYPSHIENASPIIPHDFIMTDDWRIRNPNDRYTVALFDFDDLDPIEFMGGVEFSPYNSTNKFPAKITVDAEGTIAFELSLEYSF